MKGAYANGVLSAFEEANQRFAAVYGTSAGGALAAWFAAGQARYAEATWLYAADRRIVSYMRWFTRRGPLLDHDFLLDHIYAFEHPLDVATLQAAPFPVVVTATDVDTGAPSYVDLRDAPVLPWLKATGRLPWVAGGPVVIDGRRFLDGGIADPIPIAKALADGHKEVVLVLNEPGRREADHPAMAKFLAKRYPALRQGLLDHAGRKNRAIALAENPPAGVRVTIIRPESKLKLHRLSRDLDAIQNAIEMGRQDGRAWLTGRTRE